MESAIKTVVSVYLKSSKGKENLGGKEFQSLVKNQLKNILTGSEDSEAVKTMREELDNNQDGKVNFQEYMKLIGYLAQSLSEQRCLEKETPAESSAQETQAEAASAQAEPQTAKEEEKEVKPAEEKKPEEEKKTDVEQEGAKAEEAKAEEQKKPEEAS